MVGSDGRDETQIRGFGIAAGRSGRLLPGLVQTALIAGVAFMMAALPGFGLLGPLGTALFLGAAVRHVVGLPPATVPGTRFAAKTVLRAGVVLLGSRLHLGILWQAGPAILILDLMVIGLGLAAMEAIGRLLRLRRSLRLLISVGSTVCGASAIAATATVIGADDDEVSTAIGIVSILGALGVLGFTVVGPALGLGTTHYGLLVGSTLQEVGHVVAAGAAAGAEALDLATLTKLTRVALLAPVLIVVSAVLARNAAPRGSGAAAKRAPLVPGFLIGFLLLGAVNSVDLIPPSLSTWLHTGSVLLTAAAMAGIGLQVDLRALRRTGSQSAILAAIGFAFLVLVAGVYLRIFLAGS